jgi:hypothetical protein
MTTCPTVHLGRKIPEKVLPQNKTPKPVTYQMTYLLLVAEQAEFKSLGIHSFLHSFIHSFPRAIIFF